MDEDLADDEDNGIAGTADPFVDWENADFHLHSIAGMNLSDLSTDYVKDMYGNIRGSDGIWDVGAIEYIRSLLKLKRETMFRIPLKPLFVIPCVASCYFTSFSFLSKNCLLFDLNIKNVDFIWFIL